MASQFPPETAEIFDPGSVPEIEIHGPAYYFQHGGSIFTGFWHHVPVITRATPTMRPTLCLRLKFTVEVAAVIRAYAASARQEKGDGDRGFASIQPRGR